MKILKLISHALLYFNRKSFIYVVLGDSTAEGLGASAHENSFGARVFNFVKEQKKNALYYNFGMRGATIKGVLSHQINKTVALDPDMVILSVGFNDIKKGRRVLTFEKNFTQTLEKLSTTHAKVYICGLPNAIISRKIPKLLKPYVDFRIKQFNERMQNISKTYHNVHFIDLYSATKLRQLPENFFSEDGLHPSDVGYAYFAGEVISQMGI